jgi:hypothetical protein
VQEKKESKVIALNCQARMLNTHLDCAFKRAVETDDYSAYDKLDKEYTALVASIAAVVASPEDSKRPSAQLFEDLMGNAAPAAKRHAVPSLVSTAAATSAASSASTASTSAATPASSAAAASSLSDSSPSNSSLLP